MPSVLITATKNKIIAKERERWESLFAASGDVYEALTAYFKSWAAVRWTGIADETKTVFPMNDLWTGEVVGVDEYTEADDTEGYIFKVRLHYKYNKNSLYGVERGDGIENEEVHVFICEDGFRPLGRWDCGGMWKENGRTPLFHKDTFFDSMAAWYEKHPQDSVAACGFRKLYLCMYIALHTAHMWSQEIIDRFYFAQKREEDRG